MSTCAGHVSRRMCMAPVRVSAVSVRNAPDLGSELRELLLDGLVTAIDVVDALDLGAALGDEAGEYQARRGAQIGGHHRRCGELLHAVDDRGVALEANL